MRNRRPSPRRTLKSLVIAWALAGAALSTGCGQAPAASADGQGGGSDPSGKPVELITVEKTRVSSSRELPGRADAFARAEIRPQVTGLIEARLFTEGATVEKGQALYRIEADEYEAAVTSAEADLQKARATAEAAKRTAERFDRLAKRDAVSEQNRDDAEVAAQQALADVAIKEAALQRARIDLKRTLVRSPISGRIGRSLATPGALVTRNQAEPLARVVQLDPIFVDLTAASSEIVRWRQDVMSGRIASDEDDVVEVGIFFEDGARYNQTGALEFSEVSVDEASGSVIVRAVVPNPEGLLMPGMFLKARFSAGVYDDVARLPQKTVQRTPRGAPYVFVADADDTAQRRDVDIAGSDGNHWIVTSGLDAGDRVIASGFQNLREGMTVRPAREDAPQMAGPAGPAGSAQP